MPTLPRRFNFCPQEKVLNVVMMQLYVLKIYWFSLFILPHSEILVLIQQRQELRELQEG